MKPLKRRKQSRSEGVRYTTRAAKRKHKVPIHSEPPKRRKLHSVLAENLHDRRARKRKIENINWFNEKSQETHTLHRSRRTRFLRSPYFVPNMNNLFQADLCDMQSLEKFKKGIVYILTTDKGKEFVARAVQKYLKSEDIKFYTTNNPDIKASIVERFNRMLKTRMLKYFTHTCTYKYVHVLQNLVHAHNNTKHSAINMAPTKSRNTIKVGSMTFFIQEKVGMSKGKGLIRKVLVKWKGYPDSFNSWIYYKDLG
ncbi:hypothetical protein B566_EDAN015257 [Ephemera danica]|nr:hypothetical protein B566_EDAN015257 [Ephemera danica]